MPQETRIRVAHGTTKSQGSRPNGPSIAGWAGNSHWPWRRFGSLSTNDDLELSIAISRDSSTILGALNENTHFNKWATWGIISSTVFWNNSFFIGKILVPLGWFPSCLTPKEPFKLGYTVIYPINTLWFLYNFWNTVLGGGKNHQSIKIQGPGLLPQLSRQSFINP